MREIRGTHLKGREHTADLEVDRRYWLHLTGLGPVGRPLWTQNLSTQLCECQLMKENPIPWAY